MIWCVEDDKSIREIEIYTLKSTGFDAMGFSNGEDFFEALQSEKPELIMLDIMLPDVDGIEILKRIRNEVDTCSIPVIMVTAKGQEYDKVQCLDLGADDYLVKPFGMMEMVSRIKAVLRRVAPPEVMHVLKVGKLELNTDERTAYVDGDRVQLTYKEYELLKLFMENPGRAFTREQLFSSVWGDDYVGESRTVDVHIQTLRSKLKSYEKMIETVRNVGYRLEVKKL
ncbi:MAG: response regulator transcription factor [Lachnospiraceae bacterium]|jgi:two-component system alkaline phosphatase synthesis response regulator PhoP|nr:response regulator transcription factor [Lachnospiraceae bacterium]